MIVLTFSKVNMSEFVSGPVLTGEILQETSHCKQKDYFPQDDNIAHHN